MEGLISTQGWQGLVTSVVISCAVDGFSSEGAFHEFSLGQCLQGAGSAVLVGGALELFAIRNKFGGIARSRLASGISRLAEATGSRVGKGWDMYRYLRPGAIRAADVAALFDVDEALAGVAATRIQQSPALQSLFREGDWWMSVRKMASSAENRAQLLDDLTGNVNLAQAFKERPELVGAWEGLPANLRTDVFKLETTLLHIDNTGKTPAQISSEIGISGSYNKWLADHIVEFVKDGHRIDATTLSAGYTHVDDVVLNGAGKPSYDSERGIVGTHNINNFMLQTVANGGRIEIVSNGTTSVTGVNKIQYRVIALDAQGNQIPGQYFANGSIFTKTTFDPSIYSPDVMKRHAYEGYHQAIETGSFGPSRSFNGTTRDGLPIAGHYKIVNGENIISTWWIDAN